MKWIRSTLAAVILVQTAYGPCAAQEAPERITTALSPGKRVRIKAPSLADQGIVGEIVGLNADMLAVKSVGETPRSSRRGTSGIRIRRIYSAKLFNIPLESVSKLEVSEGRKSRVRQGAFTGFAAGIVMGAIALASLCASYCDPAEVIKDESGQVVKWSAILGGGGALLGAAIGSSRSEEKWRKVPLDRIRLGLSPEHRGELRLAASFGF